MKINSKSIVFIVLCLIAALAGSLWAADILGVINIKEQASKLSYKNILMKQDAASQPGLPVISPIEKENQELRAAIKGLEEKVLIMEGDKTKLLEQLDAIQQELTVLRAYKTEQESFVINTGQMAAYYSEMKPDAVVKVMNNLDDNTVMAILPLLETEQVAKILALMEPQRAALLTQLLLGGNSPDA